MPSTVAGISCDTNEKSPDHEIGDFFLSQVLPSIAVDGMPMMRVNARGGLRLRAGPGTEFDSLKLLPLHSKVHPLRTVGSWTLVDLHGDGHADGYVSSGYLSDDVSLGEPLSVLQSSEDAYRIQELIRQGATEAGLKAARAKASKSLPGYPTNGCAAHLSALLQQAGIDVPMTWGAGKLAHTLEARGWGRVSVSEQIAGDVGVCFDNDPTPPGADHVYLVVETLGSDKMLIADNQWETNTTHTRYASGQGGKTPTEYFLRAFLKD